LGEVIFIARETGKNEPRVAASPETVKKLIQRGLRVQVEEGAGVLSHIADADYAQMGAEIVNVAAAKKADIILKVRRPSLAEIGNYKEGAVLIAMLNPYGHEAEIAALAKAGITAFAMEFMPRITRAQTMDVLSSQANLAGYRAVLEAAQAFDRALPMMMTAAGTVPAAKVFVMGAGVAGLQAIATARRLGAVVSASDVRPAVKEQVASLGAKFIAVEDDEFHAAETAAGYAREMSREYQEKQAALIGEHIAKQDIIITTALIPGKPAPILVTKDMLKSMNNGSVVVDLAIERGGNVEGAQADKIIEIEGVRIIAPSNMPAHIGATASQLYARNLYAFIESVTDKDKKGLVLDFEDEIIKATCLTHEGTIIHPLFADYVMPAVMEAVQKPVRKRATGGKSATKSATRKLQGT